MPSTQLTLVKSNANQTTQADHRTLTMPVRSRSAHHGLREGTTGRLLLVHRNPVPRIFAVAAPATQPAADFKQAKPALNVHRPRPQNAQPDVALYREYTEALLRRYQKVAHLHGRVNSLLGRELFRGAVTSYQVRSFDEVIIFCADIEKCLKRLQPFERRLINRIALQGYTKSETAIHVGVSESHCVLRYRQALDKLTGILIEVKILDPQNWCQERKSENGTQTNENNE